MDPRPPLAHARKTACFRNMLIATTFDFVGRIFDYGDRFTFDFVGMAFEDVDYIMFDFVGMPPCS
jgi:hypothetical protein